MGHTCDCDDLVDLRAVDTTAWDGPAAMSRCANSDSPASCYRQICAGQRAGDTSLGKTWALPHHKTAGGPPNAAGVRNCMSRLPQTQGLTNQAAARRHLEAHMAEMQAGANAAAEAGEIRSFHFELRDGTDGDGLTLDGYAAVFDTPTRIDGWEGEFDEKIARGAFARTLAERTPKLMFEHGRHPLLGSMPLGVITVAEEDQRGLHVVARLSDNWLIQPVRDAVRDGAVDGMSFRFLVPDGGDRWTNRKGKPRLRTLVDLDVPELGPVVFPAYEPTTVTVRGMVDRLDEDFTGQPQARSQGGGDTATRPGSGRAAPSQATRTRDRVLRLKGIIP